jgi:putative heme-binding domain-containing protein
MVVRRSDGALYFTTGGRRLQSALYRVTYTGSADLPAGGELAGGDVMRAETEGMRLRTLRHDLEQLHETSNAELEIDVVCEVLPCLAHTDRHIRYAARTAMELQPTETWLKQAVPNDVNARIEFAIAAARHARTDHAAALLATIDFETIRLEQKLGLLRAYGLASVRLEDEQIKAAIIERFARYFPSGERTLDRELCRVLAYAGAPGIVEKALAALAAQSSIDDRTHYLFALSTVQDGWLPAQRRTYFEQLAAARSRGGGKSYGGYIDAMAQRSIQHMPSRVRPEFRMLADKMARDDEAPIALVSAEFVREWSLDEVRQLVAKNNALENRDLQNGRRAFAKANCFACHQVGNEGGAQGPNLTSIGARFSPADMVVTIVDPSREVSDQYAQQVFEMSDGRTLVGRVVNLSGDQWYLSTDMMNPGYLEQVMVAEVESMQRSPASPMPAGLLHVLDEDEALDLLAYLVSLRGALP